jgi:RecA/RadA recombinase
MSRAYSGLDHDETQERGGSKRNAKVAKFRLVPFEDIRFVMSEEWLIKKLLPQQGVAVVYGSPGSFKSFVAMDLALHVALGWDWAGHATTQGDVVYIAAENVKGMRKRKLGFEMAHDATLPGRVPFYLIEVAPNLGTEKNDLDALIASVEAVGVKPRLIVIDTLAQTLFGGEENGAGMVIFVANATALANRFNACVLAVHHVPLADDERLRGHGSLHGGADAELLTERPNGKLTVVITLKKLKDEEDSIKLTVRLDRIVIAQDEDGDDISTLVVGGIEHGAVAAIKDKAPKKIPESRRLLMDMITQAVAEAGQDGFRSFADGPLVRAVHDEAVRSRYYARIAERAGPLDDPDLLAERQRKAFNRAVEAALKAKSIFARADDGRRFLWLP